MSSTSSYSPGRSEVDILAEEMKSLKLKRGRPAMSDVEKAKRDIQRLEEKPDLQKFKRPSERKKMKMEEPEMEEPEMEEVIIIKQRKPYTRKSQVYKPKESKDPYFRSKTPKKSEIIYYGKTRKNTPSPIEMLELTMEGKNKYGRKKITKGGRRTRKVRRNRTRRNRK